ncbi:MAG: serine/threonine protein kinase [Gammaproteobacteria bacterium]|nr:serine/threonine protein kinase [Gammaproteobacteria bacterium]NIR97145.1 serine/threonine protein kinase [Gammaproteobacteria bacterium]NIT62843.1 serine/threonine protein kinase [Gammaproteobacteria bacterium]NIV19807.1 protein kinase [Gammaproteobacteria bacterium]NIX11340.1 protein kinase [Gammaproteobacteria bacterium]
MPSVNNSLPPNTKVDEYIIRSTLGGGGFSVVYLASECHSDRPVVIKEYMPTKLARRHADQSISAVSSEAGRRLQSGRALFFQEASILATLKHPNIVEVLNFFRANETVYMVMAYEDGENLQHYIKKRRGKLSERFLLTVFPALINALKLIHSHGYLHLDVKPGNIHLRRGGSPLLLDFGAVHRRMESRQRMPGQVCTTAFSPTEQYDHTGYVGPWTDLYALGATMRACVDGRPPPDARARQVKDELRPAAVAFRRQYSQELLEALDWALEVDPLLRPQSADELLQALPPLEPLPDENKGTFFNRFTGTGKPRD